MTHPRNRPASSARTLPADGFTGRAYRARAEPMVVRPLRDDRYVVETDHGTYVVDLDARSCTCPDHAIRGARCKHLRRVAIEVTAGRVPPPGMRTGVCAVCGRSTFVPRFEAGPHLCADHEPEPGELVRDRETGQLLVVIENTGERADERLTAEGIYIARYPTNDAYGDHEPVIEAVYVGSIRSREGAVDLDALRRYGFPASRLRRLGRTHGRISTALTRTATGLAG
ncbi:SWIM zinc finger family protein [Haloferacaceae archaeon DSL9]